MPMRILFWCFQLRPNQWRIGLPGGAASRGTNDCHSDCQFKSYYYRIFVENNIMFTCFVLGDTLFRL